MKNVSDYPIAVIVGRFQVHELHSAHHYVIKQAVDNHKKVILFLGVPKTSGTKRNPLDFETRKRMIQKHYPEITILSIPDFEDDQIWTSELDKRVREVYPIGDVLMYGSRDSFIPFYQKSKGKFDCKELEQHTFVSGTEVRKIVSEQVKESPDFRAGVIYQSYNQFPKVHPCVDIAILNEDESKVLLGKIPNENWRFIGGFVSPNDESYEMTARKKVIEKTSIEIGKMDYITSLKIDDWRYRSEEDKIHTTFFKCKYLFGRIEPSQEFSELKWFDIKQIRDMWFDNFDRYTKKDDGIVKEHQKLLEELLKKLNKK